jgi:diguanylate cyclase (GGDEF)-like protein
MTRQRAVQDNALTLSVDLCVFRDKAAILYDHGKASVFTSAFASIFLFLMVQSPACWHRLLLWFSAVAAVLCLRAIDIFAFHARRCGEAFDGQRAIVRYAAGMLSTAALWAAFPLLFFPLLSDAGRAATSIVVAALAAGSATVHSASLKLTMTYCAAQILPVSIAFLLLGGRENTFLGLLGQAMLIGILMAARVAHQAGDTALRLNRRNEELVAETERQRAEAESSNRELALAEAALSEANHSLEARIEARTADLAREISERQRYADALARLASTDPLAGLCNRITFSERLACMLAETAESNSRLAVLFLDLDGFKQVNDVRGHATGDSVLQQAAGLLVAHAGDIALIARWGGDEFVLAMRTGEGAPDAERLARRLRRCLTRPMKAGLDVVRIDASIGIATFPDDGISQDALIRAADVAMYDAKREGKGRIRLFDRVLAHSMEERHLIEQALREAIGNRELSIAYQPIVSARTGTCEAFEALLRWQHPRRGPINPADFIPIAEQSGQIGTIGRWVLAEACRAAAAWPEGAPSVTVNVSVAQVLSGTLIADIEAACAASGLPTRRLQVEITESMFVSDHVRVTPILQALRHRGIRILLDDFGTGFSSLAYLGKLPIDVIKIDQSFIRAAEHDGYAVIGAILSIARAMSLDVTAEGVETETQQCTLRQLGVDRLQGYLLGRPMPADAVVAWLSDSRAAQSELEGNDPVSGLAPGVH